ncbi:MAG: D-3-phosphoglycerate dehydrogenase / 2-oxoglutarate reductase [Acidimicrobiaceae bacterium]|nr:D-3-phosphoglycerate dehydrogenase / 2-oxoglutarate reductase [Acidimicrobiaceae bacterium]
MARVLVTEEIAERGLATLRAAGHDVDVRLGLSATELLVAVAGAAALVIRSETKVTAAVIEAGHGLVVVGRAGIGLDNVDVVAATRRGVMVVNAPRSNILSAAEHTLALLLAQARNIPQAHAALTAGRWERSRWEGVEVHGKTLGIVGLGRVGALVAQRAHAFGMRLVAFDPYVAPERAKQMGVELLSLEDVVRQADFLTVHLPKTPETIGLIGADLLAQAKPDLRVINTARGGIVDEAALAAAVASGAIAGAAIDVFSSEPMVSSPLFELPSVVVTPHLGASTKEAQDKAGISIAEQVELALAGEFVPYAVNIGAAAASETVRPFLPLAERLGRLFGLLAGELAPVLEIEYEGQLAEYDTRILTLSVLKGLFSAATDEPVSFVNAPQLAEERGLSVRATTALASQDYVNLITLRGGSHALSGTLFGMRGEPKIVMVDDHDIELPFARSMLVVRNDDRVGMVAVVAEILRDAGMNIVDLKLGRSRGGSGAAGRAEGRAEGAGVGGRTAMMALSFEEPVKPGVVEALLAAPGILGAVAIAEA